MKVVIIPVLIGLFIWLIAPELLPRKSFKNKKVLSGVKVCLKVLGILIVVSAVITALRQLISM